MLIVRRAERDAAVPGRPHSDEPDTVLAIAQKPRPDDPGSQPPSWVGPAASQDGTYTFASVLPAVESSALQRCGKVLAAMAHPDPPPAEFPVDPLSIVRAWLWRHSSQPNGDPWDGDPEHLDWAARNLLEDLIQSLLDTSPSTGATGCTDGSPPATFARRDKKLLWSGDTRR